MVKAILQGISSSNQYPLLKKPYTPTELNIQDLNTNSTSVPIYKTIIVDSESGTKNIYYCYNVSAGTELYTERYIKVNETQKFSKVETTLIDLGLRITG